MELQIHYIGNENGEHMFEVIRGADMRRTAAIPLPDASVFPVMGESARYLSSSLRWYLEEYLQSPFGAYQQLAENVADTMRDWGTKVFDALFVGYARDWYHDARRQGIENLRIVISSDSPEIMSWPWEALYSQDDGWLALRCCIERRLSNIDEPPLLPKTLAQDTVHILYVIPRPYGDDDVDYPILAQNLTDYINENNLPVMVDVLRPPTFDQLQKVLYEHPGYYHIVHFDGHGGYGMTMPAGAKNVYTAPEGQLVFEKSDGTADSIDTTLLAQLLAEYKIPIMVMNACQSGMIDNQAQDPFACVAAGFLKAGIRSVVAMGYSLYVSAAKEFVPAFYERLISTGRVSEAVRAGRKRLLQQPERDCIIGKLPLQDWIVPVLYQQTTFESEVLPKIQRDKILREQSIMLPEEAKKVGDYGFIGRRRSIQKLERAALRQRQAGVLIHGQAGIGKTTLAKGFLHWLKNTNGLQQQAFWFNFQEIHSAEYIINTLVSMVYEYSATAKPMGEKLEALIQELQSRPYWIVWDNFESASGIEGTEIQPQLSKKERDILARLLEGLRGGRTKILITSRTREEWLSVQSCFRLPLEGLAGEELWEYCNAVVKDLGLTLDRSNKAYVEILKRLCGNPLAIRAILLRLQDCDANQILAELDTAFHGQEGDESTRRLQAAYQVFSGSFSERFLPILQVTGLHEYYVDIDLLNMMLDEAGYSIGDENIVRCYHILENSGFCTKVGQNVYQLHPALRGYLIKQMPAPEKIQEGFVNVMGEFARALRDKPLHEVGFFYRLHLANLYYARHLAEIGMMEMTVALTESLAYYAMEIRQFAEANKLYMVLSQIGESNNILGFSAVAYHQLGMIAQEQRQYEEAERWYKKSLKIKEKQGNEQGAANTYHQLGIIAGEQRRHEEAERWCKKALEIEEKQGNGQGAAMTYHQLGRIAQKQKQYEEAERWYKKSLKIKEKQGNEQGAAMTYYQLGRVAEEQRQYEEAERWYKKSLEIEEKQGNEHGAAMTYHQLGIIAQGQGQYEEAERWYKKSLKIKEKQGDEHGAAMTYYQLGRVAEEKRQYEEAERWYKKSLGIEEKEGDEHGAAMTYHQLGRVAEEQRQYEEAERWYKKALEIEEKQGNEHGAAKTYHQLGRIAQEQKIFQQAGRYYLKALEIFFQKKDMYSVEIATRNYAILLHIVPDIEQRNLREMWAANMPEEAIKILEQVEEDLNDTDK